MATARARVVARAADRGRGRGGRGGRGRGRGGRGRGRASYVERRPREAKPLTSAQLEKLAARAADERAHWIAECEAARSGVGGARSHGRCAVDAVETLFERRDERDGDASAYEDVGAHALGVEEGYAGIDGDVEALETTLGVPGMVVENLRRMGMRKLTVVQRYAMPLAGPRGVDVLCNAPTGSGKTAAFMLPLISRLVRESAEAPTEAEVVDGEFGVPARPKVLVLAPTRELALQIHMETRKFIFGTPLWCACAYGGSSIKPQLEELAFAPEIIVATPGRLLSMVREDARYVDLSGVQTLVMDEADRMLDMGFEPQLNELLGDYGIPAKNERQTLMFSATFPPQVLRLASYYMRAPPHAARVICGRVGSTVANIKQVLIETPHLREQKLPYLLRVLEAVEAKRENDGEDVGLTLIFCKQKGTAEWLRQQIVEVTPSLAVEELHGSLTQGARLRALDAFATGAAKILVATDVAARGLDMPDVNHVINFDMPTKKSEFDDYIHRIGRTGRAGRKGIATSFYIPGFAEDIGNGPIYENLKLVFEETQNELPGWFLQSRDARGSVGGISSAYDRGFKGGRARRF